MNTMLHSDSNTRFFYYNEVLVSVKDIITVFVLTIIIGYKINDSGLIKEHRFLY